MITTIITAFGYSVSVEQVYHLFDVLLSLFRYYFLSFFFCSTCRGIGAVMLVHQLILNLLYDYVILKLKFKIMKTNQVIEFSPKRAFERFANNVSDDRRVGDTDPDYQAIGDTSKLLGTFLNGSCISETFCYILTPKLNLLGKSS